MQGTTYFHHDIPDALLPQPDPVFDNATALHATVDMLDTEPTLVQRLVGEVLLPRQLLAAGLTERVWTLQEVLLFRVPPWPQPVGV